jgi:FtsP/CotA-like multicopper oxidase with cupredoxin domain
MHSSSFLSLLSLASFSVASTVKFQLNVTWGESTLVGATKQQFLMNGQSPGPALNIDVGDSVEFTVLNNSPYNTSVHFHGITQLGTVSHFARSTCENTLLISLSHGPMVSPVYRNVSSTPARTSHTSGQRMNMVNIGITVSSPETQRRVFLTN